MKLVENVTKTPLMNSKLVLSESLNMKPLKNSKLMKSMNMTLQFQLNPIPVELWNDVNRRGRAIMARIEFLPQI